MEDKDDYIVDPMDDIYYGLILPETDRVKEKRRLAAEKRAAYEKEREEMKKYQAETEQKKKRLKEKAEEKEKQAKAKKDEEMRKKEDAEAQLASGTGNIYEFFQTIYKNTSQFEVAFANYDMNGTPEFSLFMEILKDNKSLLSLSLSRKMLKDSEGLKIAEMLTKNRKLRRLELEGNYFGPDTCKEIGKALEVNNTLRYLDLENNMLTKYGTDNSGIRSLFQSLKKNTMLISLNLSNNFLNENAGELIIDLLEHNKIIIHLEYFQNEEFEVLSSEKQMALMKKNDKENYSKYAPNGLDIEQIRVIKQRLKNNFDAYMKMRTDEWKERKIMTENYEDTVDTKMQLDAQMLQDDTRNKEHEYIQQLFMDNFNQHVKDVENQFNNAVNEYFAETKERLTKKKKKRGKKKK